MTWLRAQVSRRRWLAPPLKRGFSFSDEHITTGWMLRNTQGRHPPKVTRIIGSSLAIFQQGQYFSPWRHETCEQRVWLFRDIFSTPVPRVHWVGISNFITCHKRDTGCSGEHCSLPPPLPPPPRHPQPLRLRDITPVLGSRAWKEKMKISPAGGCGRWPADIHIVSWLLIDLRAVKSSRSHKARRCLFI